MFNNSFPKKMNRKYRNVYICVTNFLFVTAKNKI